MPCCVHIECGDSNEGKCVNTPTSGVGDCKGDVKVSVLPWRYRSTSWNQLMLWQRWRLMPRGETQNHVLHALPRRTEHRVHKRIYDSGGSGDPCIPGRAPPWWASLRRWALDPGRWGQRIFSRRRSGWSWSSGLGNQLPHFSMMFAQMSRFED